LNIVPNCFDFRLAIRRTIKSTIIRLEISSSESLAIA
jgi:hypothetical protein